MILASVSFRINYVLDETNAESNAEFVRVGVMIERDEKRRWKSVVFIGVE